MKCECCKKKEASSKIRTKDVCPECFYKVRRQNFVLHKNNKDIPDNFDDIRDD